MTNAQPTTRVAARRLSGLLLVIVVMLGVLFGLGAFTFVYGDGTAYLSNDPASCANCHVMQEHYDTWQASSHHHVAVCNDCHAPHDFFGKWITKADNGLFHSVAFTTGRYPDPIQIKKRNSRVTQETCVYCHAEAVHHMLPANPGGELQACVHCHAEVGHAHRAQRGPTPNR